MALIWLLFVTISISTDEDAVWRRQIPFWGVFVVPGLGKGSPVVRRNEA